MSQIHRNRSAARASSPAGASVLPRHGGGDPGIQDELLLIEMELLRACRARERGAGGAKQRIIHALRRM